MTKKPTRRGGKFIYALSPVSDDWHHRITGINKSPVYRIGYGKIGAVVSDIFSPKVRPDRRNLSAHQAVLKQLNEAGTVLPMRFGMIAASADATRTLLAINEGAITEQLARVAGKVEMGLRLKWGVGNIFEHFVCSHPRLREERDRICQENRASKRDEKIALGKLFESLLEEQRAAHHATVERCLKESCYEIRSNPVRNEYEIISLACLIDRAEQSAFEEGVFEASTLFSNDYIFDYTGPWAPHNFVDLDLDSSEQRQREKEAV